MAEVIVLEDVATDCYSGKSMRFVQGNQEVEGGGGNQWHVSGVAAGNRAANGGQ